MQKPKARDGGGWAGRKWRLSIPGSRDGIIAKKGSRTHSKNKVVPLSLHLVSGYIRLSRQKLVLAQ